MRKLLPILLIFTGCAMRAQQSFPGINITPNGGAAGKVQFRTSANVNSMFIQNTTFSSSAPMSLVSLGGTSVSNPDFKFESGSGYVGSFYQPAVGGWSMTSTTLFSHTSGFPGTSHFGVLASSGEIATSSSIGFYESTGLSGNIVKIRAPSGGVTADYTINLPGTAPTSAGQVLTWVTGSTYAWQTPSTGMTNPMTTTGDIIYSNSGSNPARLGIGSSGQCLVAGGTPAWGACADDPAWTSYTPTVAATSGAVVTTTALSAAYIQRGKTIKVRVYWEGSINATSAGIGFTTPVNPISLPLIQTIAGYHIEGADALSVSAGVFSSINVIGVSKNGVGGLFPASTTIIIAAEGVYEAN